MDLKLLVITTSSTIPQRLKTSSKFISNKLNFNLALKEYFWYQKSDNAFLSFGVFLSTVLHSMYFITHIT